MPPAAPSPPPEPTYEDLVGTFEAAAKPSLADHRIGTELECFGIALSPRPAPVRYTRQIEPTLRALRDEHGWREGPNRGRDGELVELVRDGASITLEPGGQLELSGAPLASLHDTCAELSRHARELDAVSKPRGICWIAAGFHPFATLDEIDWVPKARYDIMRDYLPERGRHALDMMARTCTVQANLDYRNEADCGRRLRLASALGPVVTALFANSPYVEGRACGYRSLRMEVWFHVDPDRCGVPPFVFGDEPFSYARYVDWALDVPMFFVVRDGRYHRTHTTFRTFLEQGLRTASGTRLRPEYGDFLLHLSTLFPNVRLKPYLEVRTADAVPRPYVCALPALWKGILHDDDAQARALEFVGDLSREALFEMWEEARKAGLASERIRTLCRTLVEAAAEGLARQSVPGAQPGSEARFLDPARDLAARGQCPADLLLERFGPAPGRDADARRALTAAMRFAGAEPSPGDGDGTGDPMLAP